jgi:hypothetical protein
VKQGCPLSPTLFNLCIDSLLKRLNKYKMFIGYKFGNNLREESKIVQANATMCYYLRKEEMVWIRRFRLLMNFGLYENRTEPWEMHDIQIYRGIGQLCGTSHAL